MAIEVNARYDELYVEAQTNLVVNDPYGERFMIYQGQQFKFKTFERNVLVGCTGCGTGALRTRYLIDAYAHCEEGQYIWPSNNTGKGIYVDSSLFIETDSFKWPPVTTDYHTESSGVHTEQFVPPELRKIPRTGGTWYIDPYHNEKG